MEYDKTFKLFAGAVIVWGAIVVAFWIAVVSVAIYALFHYGVL